MMPCPQALKENGDLTLANDETISNASNGIIQLARVDSGALTLSLSSDTSATISNTTGDLTLDAAGNNVIIANTDKDFPKIRGIKEGLHQYYDIEKTTDLYSLNSGLVQAKVGANKPQKNIVKLLQHLQTQFDISDVFIEGVYGEVNASLFRAFPIKEVRDQVMESYLISVPVLKAHSLAGVTLSMKNMMGACPPEHYCKGGHWKKSSFHAGIQEAVADLNRYRKPDFAVIDATIGLAGHHLAGPACDPAPGLLLASYDPVAADAYACGLLEKSWESIGHIASVDGELGQAEHLQAVKV